MSTLPERCSISWQNGRISYINQNELPKSLKIISTDNWQNIDSSIKSLAIRGAPLIGVAAALALAAEAFRIRNRKNPRAGVQKAIHNLRTARPTAVNLSHALDRMQRRFNAEDSRTLPSGLEAEALSILEEDRASCERIAGAGQELIPANARILTICNTGFLATAGIGTALGVIYRAFDAGKVAKVYVPETRPLLQGARLTMWELTQASIPCQLLVDSAIPALLRRGVDLAIIGADRIAANGDMANKIGSHALALACREFKVPLYVAAPLTSFDPRCPNGSMIPIEMRDAGEVSSFGGRNVAPEQSSVFNPAFDIVEARFIAGFVTDAGIIRPPYRKSIKACLQGKV